MKYMSVTQAKVYMLFTFISNITHCCAVHSVTCIRVSIAADYQKDNSDNTVCFSSWSACQIDDNMLKSIKTCLKSRHA